MKSHDCERLLDCIKNTPVYCLLLDYLVNALHVYSTELLLGEDEAGLGLELANRLPGDLGEASRAASSRGLKRC